MNKNCAYTHIPVTFINSGYHWITPVYQNRNSEFLLNFYVFFDAFVFILISERVKKKEIASDRNILSSKK